MATTISLTTPPGAHQSSTINASVQSQGLSTLEREYSFFVTTEEPHGPEGTERVLIRRLVMRNFFSSQSMNVENTTPESCSKETVQARKKLRHRFRLLSEPGESVPVVDSKKKGQKGRPRGSGKVRNCEGRGRGKERVESTEEESLRSRSHESSEKASPPGEESAGSRQGIGKSHKRLLLTPNPNAHRFDPFDALPVPGTPELDMLFKLYKAGSRRNSIAVNAGSTWWSFISNDAGLMHATLATWALYGMVMQGVTQCRVEKLRHKNKAIKQVNAKIASAGGSISDELVGTVCILASFENLVGEYTTSQLHTSALKRMVNARGGIGALRRNEGLLRGIIWVDFHNAAAYHTPPTFSRIDLDQDAPTLPDALLEEAAYTSPTSLIRLSLEAIDCFNIFYHLHRLALALSSRWIGRANRLTISKLLYEVEYSILSIPDYSRDFVDFDMEMKEEEGIEEDEEWNERARMADSACVVEALMAACQIFVFAALRDLPSQVKLFEILLDRLRMALNRPKVSVISIWKEERCLNFLCWALVVACSVAPSGDGRAWWIGMLVEVVKDLELRGEQDLEKLMRGVAWMDDYFGSILGPMWEKIVACMRSSSTDCAIGPLLLQNCPLEYVGGRWRFNGWYI